MRISDWSSDVCSSDLVLDLKAAFVFQEHDPVAASEHATAPLGLDQHVIAKLARFAHPVARRLVQFAHHVIGMGEDDPRLIGRGDALAVPTLDKLAPRLFARLDRTSTRLKSRY